MISTQLKPVFRLLGLATAFSPLERTLGASALLTRRAGLHAWSRAIQAFFGGMLLLLLAAAQVARRLASHPSQG